MFSENADSGLLATLLTALDDSVIAYDRADRVVAWNTAAEQLWGIPAREAIGCALQRVLPSSLVALCEGSGTAGFESVETSDTQGGRLALSVKHARHATRGGVLIMRRVQEVPARRSEAAFHASHERLSLALAASGLGDWSWDAASDVVTCSRRAAEIFSIPPGPHMTWTEMRALLHPDDREPARLAVEAALSDRGDYAIEYRLLRNGHERWISASGRGLYGADGDVLGMLGVVQDITHQRFLLRVEDALRSHPDPAGIAHTAARVLGQHLRVNRSAYAFIEADQDAIVLTGNYTDGVSRMLGHQRLSELGRDCLRLMRAGEPFVSSDTESDARIAPSEREPYRAAAIRSMICVPIRKAGQLVAAMAVQAHSPRKWQAADVELVRHVASRCWESIERARIEREREDLLHVAERANRAKDEFLAMLGHELRNPLAPITTALALMQAQGSAFMRERTIIERQVAHLTRLVDDLLDVSRIAQGKVELKSDRVELADVVSRAIEVADPLLESRAHTLKVQVAPVGMLVQGDPARLVQVVSNLLTNAAKYTPQGGEIQVIATAQDDAVQLRVLDNGIGMPAEIVDRVFDVFVQGRQTIERAHGGLGLGLAIVKSLVERHGGTVSARSAGPNQGSEFVVRLPRATAVDGAIANAEHERAAAAGALTNRARVLVVDDNEDAADMLAAMLGTYNCEVSVAHDALQALRSAAEASFELALLDIGLPVIDGYELAGRLRELPHLATTRLVAVTGYGQESDRQRALAAGFEAHLVKPVDRATIEKIVTSLRREADARDASAHDASVREACAHEARAHEARAHEARAHEAAREAGVTKRSDA